MGADRKTGRERREEKKKEPDLTSLMLRPSCETHLQQRRKTKGESGTGSAKRSRRSVTMHGFLRGAAIDCLITFLWVFTRPALSSLPKLLLPSSPVILLLPINALLPSAFELLTLLLGGGSYNPSAAAASHLAGISNLPPLSHIAFRIPLQAAASATALLFLLRLAPKGLRRLLSPPAPTDTPLDEAAPTFLSTIAFLIAKSRWRSRILLRNFLLSTVNILLRILLPLPSAFMNPLIAFAWAFSGSRMPGKDHFYIYWAGPYVGALSAGLAYRLLLAVPPPKVHPIPPAVTRFPPLSSYLRRPLTGVGSAAHAAFRGLHPKAVALTKGGKALPRSAPHAVLRAMATASPLQGELGPFGRVLAPVAGEEGNLHNR